MRYALAFLLGVLLLIVTGLTLGYISLDFSAPGGPQLSLVGALAYNNCNEDECVWEEDVKEWWQAANPHDGSERGWVVDRNEDADDGSITLEEDKYIEDDSHDPYASDADEHNEIYEEELHTYNDAEEETYHQYEYGGTSDEWTVEDEEWVEPRDQNQHPWYVQAFPGFGQMAQQIIPGLQIFSPAFRPSPAQQPPPRPVYAQPSCWIAAQPTRVAYGGSSVLQWSSFYASQARLSDVGQVPLSGTRTIPSLNAERVYSLSVSGPGGSSSCYTHIAVEPQVAAPACVISAYPSAIRRGQTANLAWGSQNASSATLSGVGAVATRGGRYVAPQQSSVYTLTVYGPQGRSTTCTAHITVNP